MSDIDPYLRIEVDAGIQFVFASRPIVLAQDGAPGDGVVPLVSDRDVVVFADEVTIRGSLAFHARQAANGTGGAGCKVQILVRQIDSVPAADKDAGLDVSGGAGATSTKIYAAPAASGKPGDPGYSIWHPITDDTAEGTIGGRVSPGANGDPGLPGGAGGSIDIRCAFAAPTAAVSLVADGGPGGSGLDGQTGGQGGPGGVGGDGEKYWAGNPSHATKGGPGGPGGRGGDGGAAGAGGVPGAIKVRVRNSGLLAFGTSLKAGAPGTPGNGAAGGPGGVGGLGGIPWVKVRGVLAENQVLKQGDRIVSGATSNEAGSKGLTPAALSLGTDGTADAAEQCDDASLVGSLRMPLTAYTAMMLDRIQTDFLALSGAASGAGIGQLTDRVAWICALLEAYLPATAGEITVSQAQLATAHEVRDRLTTGVDYYGHHPDWVPLGSIGFYQEQFAQALKTLQAVEKESDHHVSALTAATRSSTELESAKVALTARQTDYQAAAGAERATIKRLIASIATKDGEATAARIVLQGAVDAFVQAVKKAVGLTLEDLIDTIGQFAFLGENPFQKTAMGLSQSMKLLNTAATKVLTVDGQAVDKRLVIGKLTAVDLATTSLQQIKGTGSGIDAADPAAVKLIAQQENFDQICSEFWNISGAAAARTDFEAYVEAVQARNADILALNESLLKLRGWLASKAETEAAIAASNEKAALGAVAGDSAIVAQLQRMVARARADCIANLALASRAYGFWSLLPGDALASILEDLAVGQPLAMTSAALDSAGEQILSKYGKAVDAGLQNRPIRFPPLDDKLQRGILVTFTQMSHPAVIRSLREKGCATVTLKPARRSTAADENPFAGHLDVRLISARCWVHGVEWEPGAGGEVRVDFEHEGKETIVSIDDVVNIVRHDPVYLMTKYDYRRPGDPAGLVEVSDLEDHEANQVAAPIGPFARWRIMIDPKLNTGVELSRITGVTVEFHGSAVWRAA